MGVVKDLALFMIGMQHCPYEEFAKLIDQMMKGFRMNETL